MHSCGCHFLLTYAQRVLMIIQPGYFSKRLKEHYKKEFLIKFKLNYFS